VGSWLLDTVFVSLLGLVVSGMVLRFSHFSTIVSIVYSNSQHLVSEDLVHG